MNRVSFITKSLGPLSPPHSEDAIKFSAGSLRVKDDPSGLHGLAYTGDLEIEFEQAESLLIDLIIYNQTEIRALDGAGTPVAPPLVYASNAGPVVARFSVGSPIINRVKILDGNDESLLLQIIASR